MLPRREPRLGAGARHGRGHYQGDLGRALHRDVRLHAAVAPVERHHRAYGGQAGAAPGVQADRPPDAGGDQGRPPVPAEVARHLADELVGLVVGAGQVAELRPPPRGVGVRRAEPHLERVLALAQQVAHGEAVEPVHVGRGRHLGAVEDHGRHGVQAVADQVDAVRARPRAPGEGRLVGPDGAADPGEPVLVVGKVGIVDETGREQVGVHAAGDGGRDAGDVHLVRYGGQGPAVVQRTVHAHVVLLRRSALEAGRRDAEVRS